MMVVSSTAHLLQISSQFCSSSFTCLFFQNLPHLMTFKLWILDPWVTKSIHESTALSHWYEALPWSFESILFMFMYKFSECLIVVFKLHSTTAIDTFVSRKSAFIWSSAAWSILLSFTFRWLLGQKWQHLWLPLRFIHLFILYCLLHPRW